MKVARAVLLLLPVEDDRRSPQLHMKPNAAVPFALVVAVTVVVAVVLMPISSVVANDTAAHVSHHAYLQHSYSHGVRVYMHARALALAYD